MPSTPECPYRDRRHRELAWASAFVVIRGTAPHFPGGAVALGRLLVGTVRSASSLSSVAAGCGRLAREWVHIVVFGVAWFGGYNVALNIAEHSLDAGTTAMIVNIGPILIALGAGLFLGRASRNGWRSAPASHSSASS